MWIIIIVLCYYFCQTSSFSVGRMTRCEIVLHRSKHTWNLNRQAGYYRNRRKKNYLLLRLPSFHAGRSDNPIAVASLQQSNTRGSRRRLVLIIKQYILMENKKALLPPAHVWTALVEISTHCVLHSGLVGQVQELCLADSNVFLHDVGQCFGPCRSLVPGLLDMSMWV